MAFQILAAIRQYLGGEGMGRTLCWLQMQVVHLTEPLRLIQCFEIERPEAYAYFTGALLSV